MGCKHICPAPPKRCPEAEKGVPLRKRLKCVAMEFKIEPGPVEFPFLIRDYSKVEKAGICSKCSLNLKAEMEALFWKWEVKAAEGETMTDCETSNHGKRA